MKISLDVKSKIDGVITVDLLEADYLDDLHKTFNTLRNQYNRPGFRAGQVPYSLIYNLYGYKTLCDCCIRKSLDAVQNFINNTEELKDLSLMQPIIKNLKFPNKNEVNYKHPGDMSFEYIYAAIPSADVEDIAEKCKDVAIDKKIAGEINDEDIRNVIERFKKKITNVININKVVDASNIVYIRNVEQQKSDNSLFFPAQGCSIDGQPIDFMGMSVGSEIELDIKDVLSLHIPGSSASYFEECIILTRLKQGRQKFEITSITAFEKKDISDDELLTYFDEKAKEEEEFPNFKDMEEYKESVKESLNLYMTCLFGRFTRTNVRENLIKIYSDRILISEEYLKYSVRNSFTDDGLYKNFLLNNIKWLCLRDALIKKFKIELTEQDIEDLTDEYELSQNIEVKNLEKCLEYGSFLGPFDNKNKNDFMLEHKLVQEILKLCNVTEEVIDFSNFTRFLKVRILENLSKYKNHESEK